MLTNNEAVAGEVALLAVIIALAGIVLVKRRQANQR
jgi:hypothetical protein